MIKREDWGGGDTLSSSQTALFRTVGKNKRPLLSLIAAGEGVTAFDGLFVYTCFFKCMACSYLRVRRGGA